MKLPLKLLQQFMKLELSSDELVEKISTQIGDVETVTNLGDLYKGILIAQIKEKKDHPDADKLAIYQLDIGKKTGVQIVAGDKTLEVGDKVAYFPPGSKIPNNSNGKEDFVVKKINLRGVKSNGMAASEKELGLGTDHSIVMRLKTDAKPGDAFSKEYELDDVILEIENKALTNRGDLFGIIGLAREITAIQGKSFTSPKWYSNPETIQPNLPKSDKLPVSVVNKAGDLCPRFLAISMENVVIAESPTWLKTALVKSGIKPINNVVDITNYLMTITA